MIRTFFGIFVLLMIATGCASYKSNTSLSVTSETEKYGNQTIELNRSVEAVK